MPPRTRTGRSASPARGARRGRSRARQAPEVQNPNQPPPVGQNPNQGGAQVQSAYAIFIQNTDWAANLLLRNMEWAVNSFPRNMDWAANRLLRMTVLIANFAVSVWDVLLVCKNFALIAVCIACFLLVGLVCFKSLKTVASLMMSVYNAKEKGIHPVWGWLSSMLNDYMDQDQVIYIDDQDSIFELYE